MWITEFREANGLTIEQLARALRQLGATKTPEIGCSDTLLYRLECVKNFCTVPAIANLIAEGCGATAAQRDELVLPQYKGTWKPTGEPGIDLNRARARESARPTVFVVPGRPVVAVDPRGLEVGRYAGVVYAAARYGMGKETVRKRAQRKMIGCEFGTLLVTFRFADEWDRMTPEERFADIAKARTGTNRGCRAQPRPVVLIDWNGKVVGRYESVRAAAEATGMSTDTICARARYNYKQGLFTKSGYAIRYAEVWDGMTQSQKQAFLREEKRKAQREKPSGGAGGINKEAHYEQVQNQG